jgi:catechol 2,3-dioxygenase-like lactoylglutathione lyase family enzyme
MPKFIYDHIHLRSRDPMGTANYFNRVFDAIINESIQSDGEPRVDIDLDGLAIFIAQADDSIPASLRDPHLGLDHFGFRVVNIDEVVADLKSRGAEFAREPTTIRPGVRVAFVRAPDDVRIELLERT